MFKSLWLIAAAVCGLSLVGCGKSELVIRPVDITVRVEADVKSNNGGNWPVVELALLGPPEAESGKFKSASPWGHFGNPTPAGPWERRELFNFTTPETGGTLQRTIAAGDNLWKSWKASGARELIVLVRNNARAVPPGEEGNWRSVQAIDEDSLKDVQRLEILVQNKGVLVQPVKPPAR